MGTEKETGQEKQIYLVSVEKNGQTLSSLFELTPEQVEQIRADSRFSLQRIELPDGATRGHGGVPVLN